MQFWSCSSEETEPGEPRERGESTSECRANILLTSLNKPDATEMNKNTNNLYYPTGEWPICDMTGFSQFKGTKKCHQDKDCPSKCENKLILGNSEYPSYKNIGGRVTMTEYEKCMRDATDSTIFGLKFSFDLSLAQKSCEPDCPIYDYCKCGLHACERFQYCHSSSFNGGAHTITSATCQWKPIKFLRCQYRNGRIPNTDPCICGRETCGVALTPGMFCYEDRR